MIHARITGTGSYLPGEPVTNVELIDADGASVRKGDDVVAAEEE